MAPRTRSCSSLAAAMAPREGPASMASGVRTPWITGDLHEVLAQLQESGSIFFHKSLRKSHNCKPGKPVQLALPVGFIRVHSEKLKEWSWLRTQSSLRLWRVKFTIFLKSNGSPQVHFSTRWKEFVLGNRLKAGDLLVFVLNEDEEYASSIFQVYIFPGAGKAFSDPQIPVSIFKKRSSNVSGSGENFPLQRTTKISTTGRYNFRSGGAGNARETGDLLIGKKITFEERQENLGDDSFDHGKAPSSGSGTETRTWEIRTQSRQRGKKLACRPGTSSLPSFRRRLFHYNLKQGRIEMPGSFVKKHCMPGQLHNDVELQGIHEESPVRTVRCQWHKSGRQMRVHFMTGWSSFLKENGLQAGQMLQFTLTSDSFFIVRLV